MDMQQQIEQVRTRIQRAIAHSYVDRYIQPRMIDEDRISFALSMLRSARVEENIALDYVFAMMLIQLALDTHDEVDEQQISQQKQLTVLAGDLYSGLYYDFLARRHDISLIRRFAEAIKEINIKKIHLQQLSSNDLERFHCIAVIESALLRQLAEHVHAHEWGEVAYYLFALKRVYREKTESETSINYIDHCKRKLQDLLPFHVHEEIKEQFSHLLV
ncbi:MULTISPECIES: heptaprenyl diphosphate synthase component 1 [Anoxybacillus]|uniref:Heptaprenyl diphosphate synthase n=1 Tax=Anoxybacillus flavithermus TaxID=33934 RepID=A0A178TBR5_9BACL|nr:heptaprenyl diphosphate synthase component 1 [Anoxybacillus flavithermus]ASA95683.1 heptaprenyl diphosphate synthase [Anoxybacillus flavithermus]ELK22240.1 heptaprenyl diphosphate synthase (HEPPPsynthase) subunit 1 [Anoxybacillus flavithermus TNO-09.006]MBE2906018.1 heptaprenyl diphosphate synthase component 1 [Anoxybacillus flavithermus]MBE2907091.1 heptaprenyl diphosphate synthase component 1 [Anoxybacillus flavithermus]MBE2910216.1 heptaprenyl diphosphate synthase component 1 [Anoxybacil